MLEGSLLLVCLGVILPIAHSVGLLVVTSHPFFLAAQDAARQFCGSPLASLLSGNWISLWQETLA